MRILIVEDEVKLAHAVKRALELQKYVVDVAYDGLIGFEMASTKSYDLIILDVMLPSMQGIDICLSLRRENIQTPLLMLTARGQVSDKTLALDSGADDYMVKPFSLEELFSRIRALLRRANKNNDSLFTVKDLTLDSASVKVTRAGKQISLSTKEFAVLEYLMRNKNKVLTKSQIVSNVWNYDADVLLTTVEVHMKHLRDKVDKPFSDQLIFTVRGFGYEIKDGT